MLKNKKGFTIIELIVVIVILAILGSIWFISYNSYLKTARDSQRKSDITLINNALNKTYSTNSTNLMSFINTTNSASGTNAWTWAWIFFLKWIDMVALNDHNRYNAWEIVLDTLQDISEDVKDPKTKKNYRMWVYYTTWIAQEYEIACSLEETDASYVLRSFKKRTASWTLSTIVWTGSSYVQLGSYNDASKFKAWDALAIWAYSGFTIDTILQDKLYLTWTDASSAINQTDIITLQVKLMNDDTWLIWNAAKWTKNGTITSISSCRNNDSTQNLQENICPLSWDEYEKLQPYSLTE